MTIISPSEVAANCPSQKEISNNLQPICDVLPHTEKDYFYKVFGKEVYQDLIADLEDYSDEPIFDAEEEVGLGDIRIYQGVAYVSTVVSHEFNNTPNCSTEWQVAPKFAKECFNEMWEEGGMRKLIAWVIFCEAIVFYPNLLMSGGFQEKDDEYMKLVNLKRNSLNKQILMMHRQFVDWNEDNGCIEFRQDLCVDEALNIVKNKSNRKVLWR